MLEVDVGGYDNPRNKEDFLNIWHDDKTLKGKSSLGKILKMNV